MLRKITRRAIVCLLVLILLLPGCISVFAEPSGIMGNWYDVSFDLDFASGALVIRGDGPIPYIGPFAEDMRQLPWYKYLDIIKSVAIEDGVTAVPDRVFSFCTNLTDVYLGADVAEVSAYSFELSNRIERFEVSPENQQFSSENGVLYNKDKTTLIRVPPAAIGVYHIPDTVTLISGWALDQCKGLTEITIPDSVTTILNSSFSGCSGLTSLIIPDSVTSINAHSFANCENIKELYISKNLKIIPGYAFDGLTSLKHITLPRNLEQIKSHGFGNCTSLESVIMFNKVREFSLGFMGSDKLTDIYYIGAYEDTFGMNIKPEYVFAGYNRHYGISGTLESGVEWVLESNEKTLTLTGSGTLAGLESVIQTYGEFYNCVYVSSEITGVEAYIGSNYTNAGTQTIDGITYMVYAGKYTINYDANGGAGVPDTQSKLHGQSIALSSVMPIKDGYVFLGWSQDKHANTPTYYSGDVFEANRDTLLYAVWGTVQLTHISLASPPSKVTYTVGEALDVTGLAIRLSYNDGTSLTVAEGFTVSGFSPDKPGEQTITVSYQGAKVYFTVTVLPTQVCVTEILPATTRTEYTVGDSFDISSVSLVVTFSDGNTREVHDGFTVEGFDSSTEGALCLSVTYEGVSTTLNVTINPAKTTAPTEPVAPDTELTEPTVSAESTETQPSATTSQDREEKPRKDNGPLLIIIICAIGGAAAAVVIVVLFVQKKKK